MSSVARLDYRRASLSSSGLILAALTLIAPVGCSAPVGPSAPAKWGQPSVAGSPASQTHEVIDASPQPIDTASSAGKTGSAAEQLAAALNAEAAARARTEPERSAQAEAEAEAKRRSAQAEAERRAREKRRLSRAGEQPIEEAPKAAGGAPLSPEQESTPSPPSRAPRGGKAKGDGDDANRASLDDSPAALPDFPWPPPEPSARAELDRALFAKPASSATLGTVGVLLTEALDAAGYSELSYHGAPGGFALVTRLERTTDAGASVAGALRFLDPDAEEPFSLATYLKRLFFAPRGYYRQIVFICSDRPFTATGETLDARAATRLLSGGSNRLTRAQAARPFTVEHQVSALIYEYRKGPGDGEVATLTPGRLGALVHLEQAGIRRALAKPR